MLVSGGMAFLATLLALGLAERFRDRVFGRQERDLAAGVERDGRVANLALVGLVPVAATELSGGVLRMSHLGHIRAGLEATLDGTAARPMEPLEVRLALRVYAALSTRADAEQARCMLARDLPLLHRAFRAIDDSARGANLYCRVASALVRRAGRWEGAPVADAVRAACDALASGAADCRGAADLVLELARTADGAAALRNDDRAPALVRARSRRGFGPLTFEERRTLCQAAAELGIEGVAPPQLASASWPVALTVGSLPVLVPWAALSGSLGAVAAYRADVDRLVDRRAMPRPAGLVFPPTRTLFAGAAQFTVASVFVMHSWHLLREQYRATSGTDAAADPTSKLKVAATVGFARFASGTPRTARAVGAVLLVLNARDISENIGEVFPSR